MFENGESPGEPFTLIFGHIIGEIENEKIVNRKTEDELSIAWDGCAVEIERKGKVQDKK